MFLTKLKNHHGAPNIGTPTVTEANAGTGTPNNVTTGLIGGLLTGAGM